MLSISSQRQNRMSCINTIYRTFSKQSTRRKETQTSGFLHGDQKTTPESFGSARNALYFNRGRIIQAYALVKKGFKLFISYLFPYKNYTWIKTWWKQSKNNSDPRVINSNGIKYILLKKKKSKIRQIITKNLEVILIPEICSL